MKHLSSSLQASPSAQFLQTSDMINVCVFAGDVVYQTTVLWFETSLPGGRVN